MSQATGGDEYDSPPRRDNNNPAPRSSQNKSQLLEATMRNVPKLKELNYTQWKNAITNSIKRAKLWEYIDGSIGEPPEHDSSNLATYYDEAAAVRGAILGSLEYEARRYIEEAFDPRDAWLALEKKYLTAEEETDTKLVSIEQRLADLRLEEGGDMIEHIAEFCRMRYHLNGTRFALDDQASISMLYRSLPPSLRQSALTLEGTEMKDFNALCARLSHLSQNPEPEAPIDDAPSTPVEDYTNWGVPEDIKAFGLTGDKNPLLEERAAVTCRDCLLKDHKAGTPECPQYEWRKELWGTEPNEVSAGTGDSGSTLAKRPFSVNTKRLSYEFSEPVKVVLDFDELGLKPNLKQKIPHGKPSAIQQCAILPIIQGRNVLAQAPPNNGKTTSLVISILQTIDTTLPNVQALVFTSKGEATAFQNTVSNLGSSLSVRCYSETSNGNNPSPLAGINNCHIFVGTPDYLLELVRRNMINLSKVRIVTLDDIDKLKEAGMEDQILGVYRHVPPLAQVVASSTVYSSSIADSVTGLLASPLQILVSRNEGISIGTHLFVKVPAGQKLNVLSASFSALGAKGVMLLCRDIPETPDPSYWRNNYGHYHLQTSTGTNECQNVIQGFRSTLSYLKSSSYAPFYYGGRKYSVSKTALVVTDAAFSTTDSSNIGVPLINYDVPNNVEDFIKRLDQWRVVDPGQSHMMLTFVAADTDEIHVIQDLEKYYGVHIAELLWDQSKGFY